MFSIRSFTIEEKKDMRCINVNMFLLFVAQAHAKTVAANDAANAQASDAINSQDRMADGVLKAWHLQPKDLDATMLANRGPVLNLPRAPMAHPGRSQVVPGLGLPVQLPPKPQMMKTKSSELRMAPTPRAKKPLNGKLKMEALQMENAVSHLNEGWKKSAEEWTQVAAVTEVLRGSGLSAEWRAIETQARATAEALEAMVPWWGARLRGLDWNQIEGVTDKFMEAARGWEAAAEVMATAETEGYRAEVTAAMATAEAARATSNGARAVIPFAKSATAADAWTTAAQAWDATAKSIVAQAAETTHESMMQTVHDPAAQELLEGQADGPLDGDTEWLRYKQNAKERETARMKARSREMDWEWAKEEERQRKSGERDGKGQGNNRSYLQGDGKTWILSATSCPFLSSIPAVSMVAVALIALVWVWVWVWIANGMALTVLRFDRGFLTMDREALLSVDC